MLMYTKGVGLIGLQMVGEAEGDLGGEWGDFKSWTHSGKEACALSCV